MVASGHLDSCDRKALPVCLGGENPNRLVSLWDMQEFSAQAIQSATLILAEIRCMWHRKKPPGDPLFVRPEWTPISRGEREETANHIASVGTFLSHAGLSISAEASREFHSDLLAIETLSIHYDDVVPRVEEIERTMRREMRTLVFIYIDTQSAQRFNSPLAGWESIVKRWPETSNDIAESSRCLALNRFAAAIFHILLVAEFGVIQVATLLGVDGDRPGWACLERLEKINQKPFVQRSGMEQQYSQLLKDNMPLMLAVKDSWRHKISHVDNRLKWVDTDFSPTVAQEILSATGGLMRRLAAEMP